MVKKRAYALLISLLLMALLLVLGMAMLSKQSYRYRAARLAAETAQARALAEAGIANTQCKLDHDLLYPPPDQRYHDEYSYSETVYDVDSSTPVGHYEVTIDRRWMEPPHGVMVITSRGFPRDTQASYQIRAELDLELSRPSFFQYVRWEENTSY
jgi:Tfp pilus assembly protein PilX